MSDTLISEVDLYCDGCASANPGKGAFGVILICGERRKKFSGGFARTTDNRMELLGVIYGMEQLKRSLRVTVYSDSQYLVQAMDLGHYELGALAWQRAGWVRKGGRPAPNATCGNGCWH